MKFNKPKINNCVPKKFIECIEENEFYNGKFNEIKPNFIVVKEEPKEKDIEAAKQLNVPIVIIKEQLSKNGGIHFITDKTENYTQGSYEEDKRNEKRH